MEQEAVKEAPVVARSADQRDAHENEPVCTICGRYGEYICDVTDQDVCSLECRDLCREHKRKEDKAKLLEHEMNALRTKLQIHVRAGESAGAIPPLMQRFEELDLPEQLAENMRKAFLDEPTPVQMQAIPCALQRRHLAVIAPTGSGKTVAYLVPVLVHIMEKRFDTEESMPLALVLASVREICIQIESVAKSLMQQIPKIKTALIVGGLPMPPQVYRLQQGVQLIVATPGRLLDLIMSHEEEFSTKVLFSIDICVVDEVDAMFAQGFASQLGPLLSIIGSGHDAKKQVLFLFFSATMPDACREMMHQTLGSEHDVVELWIGNVECKTSSTTTSTMTWNRNVIPQFEWVDNSKKKHRLFEWLNNNNKTCESVLVFVDSKLGADFLAVAIEKKCKGITSRSIHSDKPQQERLKLLEHFLKKDVQVLVTTNVLGRGMDLINVDEVVVFDFPQTVEQFVHLIGRAGHSTDRTGHALVFINQSNASCFQQLIDTIPQHQHAGHSKALSSHVGDRMRACIKQQQSASTQLDQEPKRSVSIARNSSQWNEWKQAVKKRKT